MGKEEGEGVGKEEGGTYARLAPLADLFSRFFPIAEPVHRLHTIQRQLQALKHCLFDHRSSPNSNHYITATPRQCFVIILA